MVLSDKDRIKQDKHNAAVKSKMDKKEKPFTKVVIRRLPPSMSQDEFLNQVSPIPSYNYIYTIKGDQSLGENAFARVYVNFTNSEDIYLFKEKFDNYVFIDGNGHEYAAVVEYASFQKVPKRRKPRVDVKSGIIEADPAYVAFLESLNEQPNQEEKPEYSYNLNQVPNENKHDITTPLLDYLKQRKVERMRIREEKREERRKKEQERKKMREDDRKKRLDEKKFKSNTHKEAKKELKDRDKEKENKEGDGIDDLKEIVMETSIKTANPASENTKIEKIDKPSKAEKTFKNRNKYEEKKRNKLKFEERKEFKSRRDDYRDRERENYQLKHEEKKHGTKPEQQKKVKKYSERREERKIVEASKEEAKKAESQKEQQVAETKFDSDSLEQAASFKSDDDEYDEKKVNKENDPRTQRRIRNKDRPTMQIYKPGMLRKKSVDNDQDSAGGKNDKEENRDNSVED